MNNNSLSAREIQEPDISAIVDYWLNAESSFLVTMGVDISKIPARNQLVQALSTQLNTSYEKKKAYCIIWEIDGQPIGHCNTNPVTFGQEAAMHLHIWNAVNRKKGIGHELVKMTLPYFFNNLQLKKLYSEPYALNPAPNKTLEKVGFELEKEYVTIPGPLNFEQPVKRWVMNLEKFNTLK